MAYRLAILGDAQHELTHPILKEWLSRVGLSDGEVWRGLVGVDEPPAVPLMLLGDKVTEQVTGYKLSGKKTRGSILPVNGGWAVAALKPSDLGFPKMQDELKPLLGCDAQRALQNGQPRIPTLSFLQTPNNLTIHPQETDIVSVDIEGTGENVTLTGASWTDTAGAVFPWSQDLITWLTHLFETKETCQHNSVYDLPELEQAGVPRPKKWIDTINLAALYDPDQLMGLEPQVLCHVPGSTAWKGLVNHANGPEFVDTKVAEYRRLWSDILSRSGRPVPVSGADWFRFYNLLDSCWGGVLAQQLIRKLKQQERYAYYTEVMQPLQPILMDMGARGLPVDVTRLAEHRKEVAAQQAAALAKIKAVGEHTQQTKAANIAEAIDILELEREMLRQGGARKFPKSEELTKLRNQLKAASKFNPDSPAQLAGILYDYFGLPIIKTDKGGRSVKEAAIDNLHSRVTRGTAKVKQGTKEECLEILTAVKDYNHWTHWQDTFLQPPIEYRDGWNYILTAYSQHRTSTGRLASGLDDSDMDKGVKRTKKAQVQNWPKELRDMVRPPDGYSCVGGDWTGFQLALFLYFAEKVEGSGFHGALLDKMMAGEFDPHGHLACAAAKVPFGTIAKTDPRRQDAKGYTFELLFEGTGRTTARKLGRPDSEGVMMYGAHEEAFRKAKWRDNLMAQVKRKRYIQTVLGWRRYFWAWQPKASEVTATYIQATEADIAKWVVAKADEVKPREWNWLTLTHDFNGLWVPTKQAEDAKAWLAKQMMQPIPWLDGRSWLASTKIGANWAEIS